MRDRGRRDGRRARRCNAVVLALGIVSLASCGPSAPAESRELLEGRRLIARGQYAEAVRALDAFANSGTSGREACAAGVLIGKANLGLGKRVEAREAWIRTERACPESPEAHECRYHLAVLSLLEGDRAAALRQFRVLADHPDGIMAPDAAAFVRYLEAAE